MKENERKRKEEERKECTEILRVERKDRNTPVLNEFDLVAVSGWSCLSSKCYRYFDQSLTWNEAKAICKSREATLLRITSLAENEFVRRMIKYDIWIGLNDIAEAGMFLVSFIASKQHKAVNVSSRL